MPAERQQQEIDRRKALSIGAWFGFGVVTSAAAGVGTGVQIERGQRPPLPKSDISILYRTGRLSPAEQHQQRSYIEGLRKDAAALAKHITTQDVKTEPRQGLQTAPYHPEINKTAVAQAILLLADAQLGTNGRNGIAEVLTERGLAVHFEGTPPVVKKGEKPIVFPIPYVMEKANIVFEGQASRETVDDFGILNRLYQGLILPIESANARLHGVPQNSAEAISANAGYFVAAIFASEAVIHLTTSRKEATLSRRAFNGRLAGATLAAGAAIWGIFETDAGGKTLDAINKAFAGKPTLGTDYAHPADQFGPLFASEYFKENIEGHLIKQRPDFKTAAYK